MPAAATSRAGQPRPVRPRVGVSGCLLGERVRFNGGHSRCRFLTRDGAVRIWVRLSSGLVGGVAGQGGQRPVLARPARPARAPAAVDARRRPATARRLWDHLAAAAAADSPKPAQAGRG